MITDFKTVIAVQLLLPERTCCCFTQVCRPGLRSFERGAFLFLLKYCPIISFHAHAICTPTIGNRLGLELFTAKLVFISEQSIRLLMH